MPRLPQVIEVSLHRKDGTVEVLPYDFGARLHRELPEWIAAHGDYFAMYFLVDAETRRYEERDFTDEL